MFKRVPFLALLFSFIAVAAHAVPVTVTFSATGISPAWNSSGPAPSVPQSTVSGTIVYEAVDAHSPIQSITSINLIIAGHTYTTNELTFRSEYQVPGSFIVGGANGGR